jgi:hypothetical protein
LVAKFHLQDRKIRISSTFHPINFEDAVTEQGPNTITTSGSTSDNNLKLLRITEDICQEAVKTLLLLSGIPKLGPPRNPVRSRFEPKPA